MDDKQKEKITTIAFFGRPESIRSLIVRHKLPKKGQEILKKIEAFLLKKIKVNPILSPNSEHSWESGQVFNPGVVMLDGKVHIIYRSIGDDGVSRFGYACSEDGIQIENRLPYPVYQHLINDVDSCFYYSPSGGSWGGCEDPRIVEVEGDDTLYMTYTACDGGLRVALTSISTVDFKKGKWRWKTPSLISPNGEIHKNWVIFPEKIEGKYAILHSISPKISIEYRDNLDFKPGETIDSYYKNDDSRKGCWDSLVRGAGPPPIKTKYGWLLFYHGMDKTKPSAYKLGAMLLDLDNPSKVLYRSKAPILEPSEEYENNGFKAGVVYASGAIVKDDELYVYYGGSDSYICVAYCNLEEFLQDLMKKERPSLIKRGTKKRV